MTKGKKNDFEGIEGGEIAKNRIEAKKRENKF